MMKHPLYEPLWPEHATLLAVRRATLTPLVDPVSVGSIQRLMDQGAVPGDALTIQEAIGVLIGDELVRIAGFEWVTLDDDYGSEPVVAHPRKMALIAPLSAVTHRFEDGDIPFDIKGFIEEALAIVDDINARDAKSQN